MQRASSQARHARVARTCFLGIVLVAASAWARSAGATPAVPGDLNEDGRASVADAVRMAAHLAGTMPLPAGSLPFADLDQDGDVTAEDAIAFGSVVLGRAGVATPTRLESSPFSAEVSVAVTRETILRLGRPLAEDVDPSACIRAEFGGQELPTRVVVNREDRRRIWIFYESALPASARVRVTVTDGCLIDVFGMAVDANADLIEGGEAQIDFDTLTLTRVPGTRICGRVLASELATTPGGETVDRLLYGAKITVDGLEDELFAFTGDAESGSPGGFCLEDVPLGKFFVHVDGRTAALPEDAEAGAYYPFVGKAWVGEPGREVNVGEIYLPLVPADALQPVSATEPTTIGFPPSILAKYADHPEFELVSITVPPDALFADDGTRGGSVGIAPVPSDRIPGKLPDELPFPIVITVQTDGATNFEEPVPACFPNLSSDPEVPPAEPGSKSGLWSFNHDTGRFEIQGPMTVDATGKLVCTDPGVGITAPGWHASLPGPQLEAGPIRKEPPSRPQCPEPTPLERLKGLSSVAKELAECLVGLTGAMQKLNCLIAMVNAIADMLLKVNDLVTQIQSATRFTVASFRAAFDALMAAKTVVVTAFTTCTQDASPLGQAKAALECLESIIASTNAICLVVAPKGPAVPAECKAGPVVQFICDRAADVAPWIARAKTLIQTIEDYMKKAALTAVCGQLDLTGQLIFGLVAGTPFAPPSGASQVDGGYVPTQEDFDAGLAALKEAGVGLEAMTADTPSAIELSTVVPHVEEGVAGYGRHVRAALVEESEVVDAPVYFYFDHDYIGPDIAGERSQFDVRTLADSSSFLSNPPVVTRCSAPPAGGTCRTYCNNAYCRSEYHPATAFGYYDAINNLIGGDPREYRRFPAGRLTRLTDVLAEDASTRPDADGDGLVDDAELIVGTDAQVSDTDGDGVSDFIEAQQGTNPNEAQESFIGLLGSTRTLGPALDVCAVNQQVVVAEGGAGIEVFNVFLGLRPVRIARVDTPGDATAVACSGRYIAVADGSAGLTVVDIVDPPKASVVHRIDLGGVASCVAAAGPLAFVGTLNGAVWTIDLVTGTVIDSLALGAGVHDLALADDHLFALTTTGLVGIAYLDGSLQVVGVTALPTPSGAASPRGRLHVGGGVAHATHARGYTTIDVTNPAALTLIASATTAQFGWRQIVPNGSGLGVAVVNATREFDGPDDVGLYDLSDPATVDALVSEHPTPGTARAASIYNGYGYIADGAAGLQVLAYLPYDDQRVAPTISLRTSAAGGVASEGQLFRVSADVSDDVQVRNVEFFVNGLRVSTDGNFPFEHRFVTPLAAAVPTLRLRARVTDTGGNATDSGEILVTLEADDTVPDARPIVPLPGAFVRAAPLVGAAFTEPMDGASLVAGFTVSGVGPDRIPGNGDDVSVAGSTEFRTDVLAAYFTPSAAVAPGTYVARVTTAVRDLAGNPLSAGVSWTFHVVGTADLDNDGLPDDVEALLGLDPTRPDTDGDGTLDGNEDLDADGLSNRGEFLAGTNPTRPDSDDDGTLDGAEDADGDGLSNGADVTAGLDPVDPDSDGDGYWDGVEVALGSNPAGALSTPRFLVGETQAPFLIRPAVSSPALGTIHAAPSLSVVAPVPGDPGFNRNTTLGQPPVDVERP